MIRTVNKKNFFKIFLEGILITNSIGSKSIGTNILKEKILVLSHTIKGEKHKAVAKIKGWLDLPNNLLESTIPLRRQNIPIKCETINITLSISKLIIIDKEE
ncbi:MAG: hypothetical protein ACJZ37_03215 [Candidatus Poseidoniales archaeon]